MYVCQEVFSVVDRDEYIHAEYCLACTPPSFDHVPAKKNSLFLPLLLADDVEPWRNVPICSGTRQ